MKKHFPQDKRAVTKGFLKKSNSPKIGEKKPKNAEFINLDISFLKKKV